MDTKIEIKVRGIGKPTITYGYGLQHLATTTLDDTVTTLQFTINYHNNGDNRQRIYIHFNNKTNETPDMAVIIESVTIEGISTDRMKWAGLYYPSYPEPWASTQENLPTVHKSATFLGWNGLWALNFTTPIFTWIHKLENLGWIYE